MLNEGKHKPGCQCGFCKNKGKGFKKKEDDDGMAELPTNAEKLRSFEESAAEFLKEVNLPDDDETRMAHAPDNFRDDEEADEDANEFVIGAEEKLEAMLLDAVGDLGYRAETFEGAGIMTRNRGLVIRGPLGKFQLTIVEDRRG